MLKKFTVEMLVGEAASQVKRTREWTVGENDRFMEKIENKTCVFLIYDGTPKAVANVLRASLRYAISSQLEAGQPVGNRYEASMIIE